MKIVCFSINPIFINQVTGGASKHFMNICQYLEQQGHEVVVLCAQADSNHKSFTFGSNIHVKPELPFHLPFPQPYQLPPGDLALICELIAEELNTADRFYMHDGELLLPFLYNDVPTVSSFRDNHYPESILGSFLTQADAVIAVSDFSAEVIKASAGRVLPELKKRIHTVLNGIDTQLYHAVDPTPVFQRYALDPAVHQIILHPHRPEAGKGLMQTILVVEKLVKIYGFKHVRVLVPQWLGEMNGQSESEFHAQISAELQRRGLEGHFIFHPWLSQEEMPEYYSAASLTLCLGNVVEAFGNVAYESLACGTPSIVAKVGVHRSQLPDTLIDKVEYGDVDAAAQIAATILREHTRVRGERLEQILNYFSLEHQLEAYAQIITQAEKLPQLESKTITISPETKFHLAPWCYLATRGIFHDYHAKYYPIPKLEAWLAESDTLSFTEKGGRSILWDEMQQWYRMGILVPLTD